MAEIKVPYYKQPTEASCGPACLKMVGDFYHKKVGIRELMKVCGTDKEYGTQFRGMQRGLKELGLKRCRVNEPHHIKHYLLWNVPMIALIPDPEIPEEENHYVVVIGYRYASDGDVYVTVHDPYYGAYKTYFAHMFWSQVKKAGNWIWGIENVR